MTHSTDVDSDAEYRRRIELMADVIEDEYDPDTDELTDHVFESVDSSRMVLTYHENINVLKYADAEPEEWKHLVAEDASWRDILQALAFDVVRQDLWRELHDREIEQ